VANGSHRSTASSSDGPAVRPYLEPMINAVGRARPLGAPLDLKSAVEASALRSCERERVDQLRLPLFVAASVSEWIS
jgi:hypothetical protein